jgi:hypothetical protein
MDAAVSRPSPLASPLRTTVDETIRRSARLVQEVAAALLRLHPADRRLFIRPLIALIERVLDGDIDPISASSAPANRDLYPVPEPDRPSPGNACHLGPP